MIGPLAHEGVWLKNGWTRTAHRMYGNKWPRTPCGLIFYDDEKDKLLGFDVRWDSLNQDHIKLCKVCWKGWETPPLPPTRRDHELAWWWAQHEKVAEIFSEAWIVVSVPTHLDDFSHDKEGKLRTHGGNVVAQGTMLNYETLKSMLTIMLQEETHRKDSRQKMSHLMTELARWEKNHPYGEPITEDEVEGELVEEPQTLSKLLELAPFGS